MELEGTSTEELFKLVEYLCNFADSFTPIFPGKAIANGKEFRKILESFPDGVLDEVREELYAVYNSASSFIFGYLIINSKKIYEITNKMPYIISEKVDKARNS